MNLGGTLTLEFEHLLHVLEDVADSAIDNGFDAVLMLNGHGGNGSAIDAATKSVGYEHQDVEVLGITYFPLAVSFIDEIRDSETGGMNHGGELETSLVMHLRPELVHEDRMEAEYLDEPYSHAYDGMFEGGPLSVFRMEEEYSETGAVGDPGVASAEKGEEIFRRLGDEVETILREIHEQNS
jgi:creatinine amidohydrolase